MKSKERKVLELEAELLRLNTLVRQRRKQLAFLQTCPNTNCECRRVWHQVVEKNLAQQMGKVRRQVRNGTAAGTGKPRRKTVRTA